MEVPVPSSELRTWRCYSFFLSVSFTLSTFYGLNWLPSLDSGWGWGKKILYLPPPLTQEHLKNNFKSSYQRFPSNHYGWNIQKLTGVARVPNYKFIKIIKHLLTRTRGSGLGIFYLFIYFLFILFFPLYSKGVRLSLHVNITITFSPHPFFCCNMSI